MQEAFGMLARLRLRLHDLKGDQRGLAAVEFAMVLPLLVTLYLGGVELAQGVSIDRKVSLTARAVADLVAQKREGGTNGNVITAGEMADIMNAAKAVISPYPDSKLKVVVSSVKIAANKIAKVDWSSSFNATARQKGQTVSLPDALLVPDTSIIWAEVSYAYTPTIGYVITGTVDLKDKMYMRPRVHDTLCLVSCS
jgi:Flp pilus assembly protein TadG